MPLPDCDALFVRYLLPWYTDQDRGRRGYKATRPDIEELLSVPADWPASEISPLTPNSQADCARRIRDMFDAATIDWKAMLAVEGTPGINWISAFDRHFQSRRIQEVLKRSDPQQYDSDYLVLCCELGAVLGAVLLALEPRLSWLYDWPYWESAVYDRQTRSRINVFHWAVKKLSQYGVEDGLVGKVEACRRMLQDRTDPPERVS